MPATAATARATMSNAGNQNATTGAGQFQARPSRRVQEGELQADGDVWQETLAVCESAPPSSKLVIRSFYQNTRTNKRVWDEPPSGASHVYPASEEMRRMAQAQLQEMHVVAVPTQAATADAKKPKKKGGLFGFRKRKDKKTKDKDSSEGRVIQYKKGSMLRANGSKGRRSGRTAPAGGSADADLDMQEAIAMSIAESQGIPYTPNSVTATQFAAAVDDEDDDELAMAKALSLSAAEAEAANNGSKKMPALKSPPPTAAPNAVGDLLGDLTLAQNAPVPSKPAAAGSQQQPIQIPLHASSQRKPPPPYSVTPSSAAAPAQSPATNHAFFDPYHKDASAVASVPNLDRKPAASLKAPPQEPSSAASFPSPNTVGRKKRFNGGRPNSNSSKLQEQAGLV